LKVVLPRAPNDQVFLSHSPERYPKPGRGSTVPVGGGVTLAFSGLDDILSRRSQPAACGRPRQWANGDSGDDAATADTHPAEQLLERADALAAGARPADAVAVYREVLALDAGHIEARSILPAAGPARGARAGAGPPRRDASQRADQTEFLVLRGGIFTQLRPVRGGGRRPPSCPPAVPVARARASRARPAALAEGLAGEAATYFRRALEFQPESARICSSFGDALNQAGDLAGARAALQRALELDRAIRRPTICWDACSTGGPAPTRPATCTSALGSSPAGDRVRVGELGREVVDAVLRPADATLAPVGAAAVRLDELGGDGFAKERRTATPLEAAPRS